MNDPQPGFIASRSQLHAHADARRFEAALQARRHTLSGGQGAGRSELDRAALLLLSGGASVVAAGHTHLLHAPALLWTPLTQGDYLRIEPGATGMLLTVSSQLAKAATGRNAEAAQLRYLIDRPTAIDGIESAEALGELRHTFDALLREIAREERGSWNALSAHLALIVIHCWRLTGCADLSRHGQGVGALLLLRFRHLVEQHFRAHWSVADYARALGVSPDRLHDLCTRSLGRTPLTLLHERVIHEARLHLVRSGQTIEQVADRLGFKSTTHFSRFFRRKTGLTPAGFRKATHGALAVIQTNPRSDADWP